VTIVRNEADIDLRESGMNAYQMTEIEKLSWNMVQMIEGDMSGESLGGQMV
jgi:hypothetical protein